MIMSFSCRVNRTISGEYYLAAGNRRNAGGEHVADNCAYVAGRGVNAHPAQQKVANLKLHLNPCV